jgi:hypothetical protein
MSINNFDVNVYSEELHQVSESEHDEVMQLMAEDNFEGYSEWSSELESTAWQGAQQVGDVLIKKACEHTSCGHFQCSKSTRLAGIEI